MGRKSAWLTLSLMLAAGCAGSPEPKDVPWDAAPPVDFSQPEPSPFSRPIRSIATPRMTSEVARLQSQLQSNVATNRVQAINRLGRLAAQGSNDSYHSIELLTRTMRADENMDVRMAATDALAGIEDPVAAQPLDSLVPKTKLPEEAPMRVGLLKQFWQR